MDSPNDIVFKGVRMRRFLVWFLLSVLLAPAQQFSKGDWKTDRSKKSIDLNDLKLGGLPRTASQRSENPSLFPPKMPHLGSVAASPSLWSS